MSENTNPSINLSDEDFGAVLKCAIRYCIDRKTYMSTLVIEFIRPLLPYVSDRTLACFERDIREADCYGDPVIDKPLWIRFLDEIQFEIGNRNEKKFSLEFAINRNEGDKNANL